MNVLVVTFVLVSLSMGTRETVNAAAAHERVSPWSTFKVPHALIGLETGVLSGPDHKMKWDGVTRPRAEWNRDQTLKSAVEVSAVWYFQRLATMLGLAREQEWVRKLGYGNARVDGDVTTFWLGGSLRISADEQVDFLRRLWTDALPLSPRTMRTIRELLPGRRGPHGEVSGKTGSGAGNTSWYVGHVTHDGREYVFATRTDDPATDGERFLARTLTEKLLRARNLWIE